MQSSLPCLHKGSFDDEYPEAYVEVSSQVDGGQNESWSLGWRAGQPYYGNDTFGYCAGNTGGFGADTAGEETEVE